MKHGNKIDTLPEFLLLAGFGLAIALIGLILLSNFRNLTEAFVRESLQHALTFNRRKRERYLDGINAGEPEVPKILLVFFRMGGILFGIIGAWLVVAGILGAIRVMS